MISGTNDRAIFVGVDPGLTGAIGIIDQDSRPIGVIDVRTRQRTKNSAIKREFDARATADQVTDRLVNYVEHQWFGAIEMPFTIPGGNIMGAASLFQTYGGLMAMMAMMEVDVDTIRPAEWKKGFGLTKSKDYSIEVARQLWPTVNLSMKKHHNQAEALLIAEFARLTWKRQRMEAK